MEIKIMESYFTNGKVNETEIKRMGSFSTIGKDNEKGDKNDGIIGLAVMKTAL